MKELVIEKDKLVENINIIKNITNSRIIAVVKGNGYGLGLINFSTILKKEGISDFAVAELGEAIQLKKNNFENVLLLTPTCLKNEIDSILSHSVTASIGSIESAKILNDMAKERNIIQDVHLKIDTGFSRYGFKWDEVYKHCEFLKSLTNINILGTFSHFSNALSLDRKFTDIQTENFKKSICTLKENNLNPGLTHIANSCAVLKYKSTHLDAVRIGSGFLGRIPIPNKYNLNKIGYMKSKIVDVKHVKKNQYVGYSNVFKLKKDSTIGIVPVGFVDGYGISKKQQIFNKKDFLRMIYNFIKTWNKDEYVNISNRYFAKIIGKISMNNIFIDLSDTSAKIGDDVFLEINPLITESTLERTFVDCS